MTRADIKNPPIATVIGGIFYLSTEITANITGGEGEIPPNRKYILRRYLLKYPSKIVGNTLRDILYIFVVNRENSGLNLLLSPRIVPNFNSKL